jgi:cytochrome c oxidase subunit 3
MNSPLFTLPGREPGPPLPFGAIGSSASGWWGAWFLMISEASLFAYVFFTYFYYSVQPPADWIPGGPPEFKYSGPQTGLVLIGCVSAWGAERAMRRESLPLTLLALGLTLLLGGGFIALQFIDWFGKSFDFATSTYSGVYFLVSGFHLMHFVVGWLMFLMLFIWTALGYFDRVRHVPISIGAIYWYFLAVAWLAVFFVLYGTPYFFKAQ